MKRKHFFLLLISLFALNLFCHTAYSATVGIRPTNPSLLNNGIIEVPVSSTFDVELYFEGLTDLNLDSTNGLVAMSINVDWDPLIELVSYSNGGTWPNMSFTPSTTPAVPLLVDIYADVPASSSPITDDHVIANFTLQCLGEGLTDLIPRGTLPVPFNFATADFDYLDSQITFEGASINQIQVVPIPSAIFLLGGGLIGLVGLRRRKSS